LSELRRLRELEAENAKLKRIAAIQRLQHAQEFVSQPEALQRLEQLLNRVHDPLPWRTDIDKRVDQMRLGQW
jgi:hypothetical protein